MANMTVKLKIEPVVYCLECKYAHLTYDKKCKICDKFPELEEPYFPRNFYCGYGERKEDKEND